MTGATLIALAPLLAILGGVFGLVIGSFLNVVVYRVPQGMSLVAPASSCPNCHSAIRRYDNIPVLSWLLLRGRCRNCRTDISPRYPLVEAGTAVAFVGVALFVAGAVANAQRAVPAAAALAEIIAFLYLAAITVALALIDLDTHTLPNKIVLPAYLVGGVLLTVASIFEGQFDSLLRAAIGMASLGVAYFVLALVSRGGMGLGDVKLAGVLGLYLGWSGWGALIVGAFAAFLLGGIYAVVLLLMRRAKRKSGIPFGPWMLGGAWIGIFLGGQIWESYLAILGVGQ